jgi:uncharacterized protein (DUF362 family)
MSTAEVYAFKITEYNAEDIYRILPENLFSLILPGDKVVLKPNWIRESHLSRLEEWEPIITHPTVITAVLRKVLENLKGKGEISILDGPETASTFSKILDHYPVDVWRNMAQESGVNLGIIDLRDDEWTVFQNVVVKRMKLPGDPSGSTQVNLLRDESEFNGIAPFKGYFGADSNILETNRAHDGINNFYRVSRTVLEADVFINLPKLKTHKKAGITCNLKNLVGINTYKNFLPHNMIGTVEDGGDQFPKRSPKSFLESKLMPLIHQHVLVSPKLSRCINPLIGFGKRVFGDNSKTVRGGSWYGNNTLWRTILDLNKVLFYANPDGTMREDNPLSRKKYISVVDGIIGGEKNGPKSPDPINMGVIICGKDPVTTDSVGARLMGLNPQKIPSIANAFSIQRFAITENKLESIVVRINDESYGINDLPKNWIVKFQPSQGWVGHIEI